MDKQEYISPFCALNINPPCCNGSLKLRKLVMASDYEWVEEMCSLQIHEFMGRGQ